MLPITFYKDYKSFKHLSMKRFIRLSLNLCLKFWARKLIKVKAHTRKQNGKVVKVRSYYRSVWGR